MKVLRALGRMLLDIVLGIIGFIKAISIPVLVLSVFGGIFYCDAVRHEILARIILDLLFGASMLFGAALGVALLVEWFKKHYH